jgi:hypothetical protein
LATVCEEESPQWPHAFRRGFLTFVGLGCPLGPAMRAE